MAKKLRQPVMNRCKLRTLLRCAPLFFLTPFPAYAQDARVINISPEEGAASNDMVFEETELEALEAPSEELENLPTDSNLNGIRLRGLNKMTARVSELEGPLGTSLSFGSLEIVSYRCWQSPPEEKEENSALLQIRELKKDEEPNVVFSGWMFSSSPGLHGLEHPVYDITVLKCLSLESDAPEEEKVTKKESPEIVATEE